MSKKILGHLIDDRGQGTDITVTYIVECTPNTAVLKSEDCDDLIVLSRRSNVCLNLEFYYADDDLLNTLSNYDNRNAPGKLFDKWFQEQHGKRPSKKPLHVLGQEVIKAEMALNRAKHAFHEASTYEQKRTSALYAWNARTSYKQDK